MRLISVPRYSQTTRVQAGVRRSPLDTPVFRPFKRVMRLLKLGIRMVWLISFTVSDS
ncbi:hypothetical protein D3C84_1023530 [compost metagenome]